MQSMSMHVDKASRAGAQADDLIAAEIGRQDRMWGVANERAGVSQRQMLQAALASATYVEGRESEMPESVAYTLAKDAIYPHDWSGFRDYGSAVANLVVASAFLRQEIKRRIANGESTERTSRRPDQPYAENTTPAVIEP